MNRHKRQINPDIEIEELVRGYPELVPVLMARGVICVQCGAPLWGTLTEAAEKMNLDPLEIVKELNRQLESPSQG